jgi:hypothetical protein
LESQSFNKSHTRFIRLGSTFPLQEQIDAIDEGEPACLDDVFRDADGALGFAAVGGDDEDAF